jgi:hypothetical protein
MHVSKRFTLCKVVCLFGLAVSIHVTGKKNSDFKILLIKL